MADSMPICDVLSEAMEYMSKLGTNIRIRSDNLKEKRIRKDKLRNNHAIHKAVEKVLLICELSKKSIENVETGVKNLLVQMEKAGASFGPSPATRERSNSEKNYEYFTYESRKLKIRNKVSLEHYTSVKVVTSALTESNLEKYPVYHDCKLYRMRNKIIRNQLESQTKNISPTKDLEQIKSPENANVIKDKSFRKVDNNASKQKDVSDSEGTLNKNVTKDAELQENKKPQIDHRLSCDSNQILELSSNNTEDQKNAQDDNVVIVELKNDDRDSDNGHKMKKNKDKTKKINTEHQKNVDTTKQSNIVIQDDDVMIAEATKDDCDLKNNKKGKDKVRTKKFKHIQIKDDSSSSDTNVIKETKETTERSEQLNSVEDTQTLQTIDKSAKDDQDDKNDNTKENNEVIKPIIKCVSLSKLLKPDVVINLDEDNTNENKKTKKKDKENEKSKERHSKPESKKEVKKKILKRLEPSDEESEEEYWARKRKEIKNFKAKRFEINIERLPNLTLLYLASHNLRRITQNGSVVCEDMSKTHEEESNKNSELEPKSKKRKINSTDMSLKDVDLKQAKSALLGDSDSDNIEACQNKKIHRSAKHALLSDSDTEMSEVQENTYKSREKLNRNVIDIVDKDNNDIIKKGQTSKTSDKASDCESEIQNIELSCSNTKNKEELNKRLDIIDNLKSVSNDCSVDNKCDEESETTKDVQVDNNTEGIRDCQQNTMLDSNDKCDNGTKSKKRKEQTVKSVNSQNYELDQKNLDVNSEHSQIDDAKKENKKAKKFKQIKLHFPPKETCKKNKLEENKTKNSSVDQIEHEIEQESNKSKTPEEKNYSESENEIESQQNMKKDFASEKEKKDKSSLDSSSNSETETEQAVLQTGQDDESTSKKSLLEDSDSDLPSTDKEPHNAEKAKNFLLDESGSEEGSNITKEDKTVRGDKATEGTKSKNVCENLEEVKKSLLHESDCEAEDNKERSDKSEENTNKESENDDTVQQSNDSPEKRLRRSLSNKDNEMVKSSLLKDSSDDHSKTPKKRKSHSGDSPPQSKRKHIMESMYAKKMLLTYSSSSDTDDEQLRNTLKEIKDYLLKGVSSDEENSNKNKKDSVEMEDEMEVKGSESKDNSTDSDESVKKVTKAKTIKNEINSDNSKDGSSKDPVCDSISDSSSKKKMGRSRITRGDSCSQNSDLLDDKEIDGLTNLESLKKTRRRRKSRSADTQSARPSRRHRMAKASGLISNEGFLQAESSSDAVSLSGSEHADNADGADLEEMPRVKLSDINGDGIGHLAKDDLLGESDTSISHDEKRDSKREDNTDEENVKTKRRKAHAISSDSEAGSSRRKDRVRLSDFEDSEEESSEPVKNKRKKKASDSDASGGSSLEDGKKKRRRIKTLDDSDGSGSDTENEGRNKHGRKNIRKVMSKNQLEEATKKAAREEKERIARIAERQKLYNNLEFDESGKPDEVVLEKVVLDFDPETKEPLIQVDRGLVKKLKPHQANGIKFMWDACFESVKRIKKDRGSGCILAHCMGLGKTLQVVSLTHTLLTHNTLTGVNRVLVVCPLSTVLNWVNEFRMWLKHAEADFEVDVYELSKFKQNSERAFQLSQWFEHGGVCVLGYEMFRNLSADNVKKFKKKMLKNFQESLVDPGPDLVVCDEGHLLKNEKTSLSQSMNRVKTRRRIVLTGTPLQNNLKEYYCMVQFVKPNLLGKYNEYLNRFVNPITNGQYTDSTEHDIRVMKRRSHVLHKMLDGAVQRRDYGVLAPFLPPKHEYVLFITLTEVQIKLYQHYLDNYSRRPLPGKSSGFLFPDFQSLQRIWTHPLVLKYNSERYEIMQQKKREREEEDSEGSLVDFIDDDSTPDESSTEESSDDLSDMSDDSRKKSKKKKSAKKSKAKETKASTRRGTRANPIDVDDVEPLESLEVKSENPTEWWMKLVSEEELEDMRNSAKLLLLFDILRQCEAIGDKLLVFSQSLYSLDLIEHFLNKVDEATQDGRVDEKLGGHIGTWSPGVDYFRLDGSTSCENRSIWCKNFNMEDNPRARLFLISTRAGGLGINLVAANRVVIFDVSWNPSHDVQSIFRVYRFGQKKPCYVYRFLAMGTMEEKIYERQVTKQAISKRVIDEQQIDRHYAENDLAELYKFEPRPPQPRPLPPLPKDRLFAEMLREHEAQIYKYHEHDSLLENKEEETLSEEERKAAWEDFENEKTRPPPQPLLSPYAMHNGMMPAGLLQAQQQQQLMYAALASMVRKDMPNMTEQQIRDAVSLIYNANPAMYGGYDYGLMQKMGDIYKYGQPGMMNPGMLNAMNAVGGGMSMGGASGLQYEPPWQRQQQQQQQMRLQQIMQQQQNSMGAKYYAGGLGSRDPMAMALQQQRARELMLRPRARGRPPHAAHAPPAHLPSAALPGAGAAPAAAPPLAADVVNLDSD